MASSVRLYQEALESLCRRKEVAGVLFAAVMCGAAGMLAVAPREYQATLRLNAGNAAEARSAAAALSGQDTLRGLAGAAQLDANESSWDGDPARRAAILREKAYARLRRNLKIKTAAKSRVVEIEYTATDPQLTTTVLGLLAERFPERPRAATPRGSAPNEAPMLEQQKEVTLKAYAQIMAQIYDSDASSGSRRQHAAGLRKQLEALPASSPVRRSLEQQAAAAELESAGAEARRQTLGLQAEECRRRLSQLAELTARNGAPRRARPAQERRISAPDLVRPNLAVYFGWGLWLGAAAALLGAMAIERMSPAVHTPAEVEARTGVRVLTTLPAERA